MRPASGDPILPFVSICRNWKTETSLKSSTTCFMKNIRVYVGCYSPHLGHLFEVWVPAALTVSPPKKVMNWSAGQFFETSGRRSRQLQLDSPDLWKTRLIQASCGSRGARLRSWQFTSVHIIHPLSPVHWFPRHKAAERSIVVTEPPRMDSPVLRIAGGAGLPRRSS